MAAERGHSVPLTSLARREVVVALTRDFKLPGCEELSSELRPELSMSLSQEPVYMAKSEGYMLPLVLGKQLRSLVVGGAKGGARILGQNSSCP